MKNLRRIFPRMRKLRHFVSPFIPLLHKHETICERKRSLLDSTRPKPRYGHPKIRPQSKRKARS